MLAFRDAGGKLVETFLNYLQTNTETRKYHEDNYNYFFLSVIMRDMTLDVPKKIMLHQTILDPSFPVHDAIPLVNYPAIYMQPKVLIHSLLDN